MDFVEGHTLQRDLVLAPFTREEVTELLRQILQAVDYIHKKGITHRDLKPANIMVQSRDPLHIKLLDFGLASTSDYLKTNCGTKQYNAPEVENHVYRYGNKVDMWSVGVIALQLLYYFPVRDPTKSSHREWWENLQHYWLMVENNPAYEFVSSLLEWSPGLRPSAEESLKHCFFSNPKLIHNTSSLDYHRGDPRTPQGTGTQGGVQEQGTAQDSPTVRENLATQKVITIDDSGDDSGDDDSGDDDSGDDDGDDVDTTSMGYFHPDPLRNPMVVGSEVAYMKRAPTREVAAKEHESSQLPIYDAAQSGTEHGDPASNHRAKAINTGSRDPDPNQFSMFESTNSVENRNFAFFEAVYYDGDLKCIKIGPQRVSMRMSDGYLNATEICAASAKDPRECRLNMRQLKLNKASVMENKVWWVPFADGVALGVTLEVLGLQQLSPEGPKPALQSAAGNAVGAQGNMLKRAGSPLSVIVDAQPGAQPPVDTAAPRPTGAQRRERKQRRT
ncbi:kinase-like domain-containing protein [Nemania sp. NC0429]|nr:kinase-like domain-containing protein [Nemania sp. NC0429]